MGQEMGVTKQCSGRSAIPYTFVSAYDVSGICVRGHPFMTSTKNSGF